MTGALLAATVAVVFVITAQSHAHHRPGHGGGPSQPAAPAGALQVVDATDAVVGQLLGGGCFLRQVNGYVVGICGLQADGTPVDGGFTFPRYFLEPDCGGTAYFQIHEGDALSRWSHVSSLETFDFAGNPVQMIEAVSFQFWNGSELVCSTPQAPWELVEVLAGPLHSIPLSSLGVPPFSVR